MSITEVLLTELRSQRRHVVRTLSGLSPSVLATPVPPATWAPITVPHHLALDVERWWFQAVVENDPIAWKYFEDNPNGAWTVHPEVQPVDLYVAESARSDAIIAAADIHAIVDPWPSFMGPPQSLIEIVVHVIGETAAHAGHLDIVREAIDGHQNLIMD